VSTQEPTLYVKCGKRIIDLSLASLALLLLSPILALSLVAIVLDSPGSPFFFHTRIGRGNRPFRLVKFRTMSSTPEHYEGAFKPGDARRITRVGKILRRAKIDELLALFNVLLGQMSIIGPRPEVAKYVQAYPEEFEIVLRCRPGLSDYASIKYRNEEEILAGHPDPEWFYRNVILPDKLRLAKRYCNGVSLRRDLGIIVETIKSVVVRG
jgi:lipopolysaccharide/colanic/teichoic acid biosynthesis glycosyltransferase